MPCNEGIHEGWMMRWDVLAIAVIGGYIFGSIPSSRFISRFYPAGQVPDAIEVPVPGTGKTYRVTSTGAAAASMTLGARAGCSIGILDMLKVALPTLFVRIFLDEPVYYIVTAAAGMIGHDWPVFNRFKGGRGISSVYGALFVIDWIGAFSVAVGGLVIGLFIFRDFIVAYMAGLWLLIPWMWFTYHDWLYLGFALVVNGLFILAMIPDLRQYFEIKKMGKVNMDTVMHTTPMGRGMLKIMEKLKLK
jgi:glycerol-3-phosphate acyltransferase PlsY